MAQKVDDFPDDVFVQDRKTGKYKWDSWLDGSVWELEQGVDYEIKTVSFRTGVQTEARKRGLKAVCRVNKDFTKLYVKAVPQTDQAAPRE